MKLVLLIYLGRVIFLAKNSYDMEEWVIYQPVAINEKNNYVEFVIF